MMERRSGEHRSTDRPTENRKQSFKAISRASTDIPSDYRRIVFSDHVAFRYLEEDNCTIVQDRLVRLQGYELYVVEQWVCSRTHPTFVICTYTGDASHSVLVSVLAIPRDVQNWSQRLKVYFQAVTQFHAREQDTRLGALHVTNLSSFPSSLTVIAIPDGDTKKHKDELIVNENLKRMGCTGRAAITLQEPAASTIAKFYHLFAMSEAVPLKTSIIELVKICQLALSLFGKLNMVYADGLLCDITERAIGDWWDDIGTEFHNIEPSDGVFGPTTVAALLGLLVGAHNRLKSAGIAIGKDVLDVVAMKRSIGHFQKAYRIKKTRRLDRETLDRLHRATAKVASGDGWAVPRAVKSTVAELSGKGGEMVLGMVGAKDKATIAEIETLDMDRFAQLVPGARMKWLWQGKPMKTFVGDVFNRQSDEYKGKAGNDKDEGTFLWTVSSREPGDDDGDSVDAGGHVASDRKLGRLRDAVGRSTKKIQHSRVHRVGEDLTDSEEPLSDAKPSRRRRTDGKHSDHHLRSPSSNRSRYSFESNQDPKPALNLALAISEPASSPISGSKHQLRSARGPVTDPNGARQEQLGAADTLDGISPTRRRVRRELDLLHEKLQEDVYQSIGPESREKLLESSALRRSQSAFGPEETEVLIHRLNALPRRLSGSIVERPIFIEHLDDMEGQGGVSDAPKMPLGARISAGEAEIAGLQDLTEKLLRLERLLFPGAESEVRQVVDLGIDSQQRLSDLNDVYYSRLDEYQNLQATSTDLISREKVSLNDALRKIEMLGQKLDYELNSLQSRMQEVEDGTDHFESSVLEIEARVDALVKGEQHNGTGILWPQRLLSFFGK